MTADALDSGSGADGAAVRTRNTLEQLLETLWQRHGSDLLLAPGAPPPLGVDGALERMPPRPALTAADTEAMLASLLYDIQRAASAVRNEVDWSFSWRDQARFRANG
ncbi:MAG: hypothetical protein H7231_11510, partial [Rhodoferax sp.]|nr:hypothetical protein [Actinomycetota bacterium]